MNQQKTATSRKKQDEFLQYYRKAQLYHREGRLQLALGYLQRTIDLCPSFFDAYHLMGEVLRKLGRTEDALRIIRQLDKSLGFDPQVRMELARLECEQGYFRRAQRIIRQVLRHKPDLPEAHYVQGELFRAQGLLEQADRCYARCLELAPGHRGARRGINEMLRRSLEFREDDGETPPSGVLQIGELELEERLAWAGMEIEQEHFDSAIAVLKDLALRHHDQEVVILALANALHRRGDTRQAVQGIQGFLSTHPDSVLAHYQCGFLLNQLKSYREAQEHLEQALQIDPDYYEACFELAVSFHQDDNHVAAEAAYLHAAELMPQDIRPRVNLAHLYLQHERLDEAEELLKRVLQIEPRCREAIHVLGNLYLKRRYLQQAQQCFETLVKLSPRNLIALKKLALIQEERRDLGSALNSLRQAVQLSPEDSTVTKGIFRLERMLDDQKGGEEQQVFS